MKKYKFDKKKQTQALKESISIKRELINRRTEALLSQINEEVETIK